MNIGETRPVRIEESREVCSKYGKVRYEYRRQDGSRFTMCEWGCPDCKWIEDAGKQRC